MLELMVRFGKGNGFSVGFARKVNAIVFSGECTRRRVPIASPRHHVEKKKSAMAEARHWSEPDWRLHARRVRSPEIKCDFSPLEILN